MSRFSPAMAMTETTSPTNYPNGSNDRQERTGRRRPFSNWVKKLAGFKNNNASSSSSNHKEGDSSNGSRNNHSHHFKRDSNSNSNSNSNHNQKSSSSKKQRPSKNNNPYPQSGRLNIAQPVTYSEPSLTTAQTGRSRTSDPSLVEGGEESRAFSLRSSGEGGGPPTTAGAISVAPTVSTDAEGEGGRSINAPSHMASSVTGTSRTANGGIESRKGGDSTFSSPAPSVRSLTTTLTTIQSMGPNGALTLNPNVGSSSHPNSSHQPHHGGGGSSHHHNSNTSSSNNNTQSIQFSQPFPTTNSPASAIPAHLAPHSASTTITAHPTTYSQATANNLLTDNASILTLASSSNRRRRRSMDTDASVRALAPSSLWGGSRESLPLSVLSANISNTNDGGGGSRIPGAANEQRTSIYSTTGIGAMTSNNALPGEQQPPQQQQRNSYYGGDRKDGASIRSGLLGHGRAESITGSVGVNSPLASPMEVSENEKERDFDREAENLAPDSGGDTTRSNKEAP